MDVVGDLIVSLKEMPNICVMFYAPIDKRLSLSRRQSMTVGCKTNSQKNNQVQLLGKPLMLMPN